MVAGRSYECDRLRTVWWWRLLQVYGDPLEHPQTEAYWGNVNPIGERSCYDEGKRAAECLTFDYLREHGLQVTPCWVACINVVRCKCSMAFTVLRAADNCLSSISICELEVATAIAFCTQGANRMQILTTRRAGLAKQPTRAGFLFAVVAVSSPGQGGMLHAK